MTEPRKLEHALENYGKKIFKEWNEYEKAFKESREMSNVTYGAYCKQDIDSVSKMIQKQNYCLIPGIAKVIYNPPATIILWEDETKTVVKCCETDIYDPEKGFAMAVIKKLCGNKSAPFHRLFKTWCLESDDKPDIQLPEINIGDIGGLLKDAVNEALRDRR